MKLFWLALLLGVCSAARLELEVSMNTSGMECVWGEWPQGLEHVAGWRFNGDTPHHMILFATTSPPSDGCPEAPKNAELVYVWGGEKTFDYGTSTVRKITPGTRYFLQVHNHHAKPLRIKLQSVESLGIPKWQSVITIAALRSGRVWPGQTKTLRTPSCNPDGSVRRLRMHSHEATRTRLMLGSDVMLDTDKGDRVNIWYDIDAHQAESLYAECTFAQDSAIGITWCNGCKREMCNAYAEIRLAYDTDTLSRDGSFCVGPPA